MPTYEYRCKECGTHLEVVQSFNDAPLTECPSCQGELRKVFGSIGITFKGSGFYKTDSRSSSTKAASSSKEATGSSGDGASSDAKSSDKSSDTKSDTKSDTRSGKSESTSSGSSGSKSKDAKTA